MQQTQKLTLSSMFVSLSIILTRVFSFYILSQTLRFDLGYVVVIYGSFLLGPFYGAVIGGLSDLIGANMFPVGAYYYGYTVSYALIGAIAGSIGMAYRRLPWFRRNILVVLASFMGLVVVFSLVAVNLNVGAVIIKSKSIVVTDQLALWFSLFVVVFAALVIVACRLVDRRTGNHFTTLASLIVFSTSVLISMLLSSYWTSVYFNLAYPVALVTRIILFIPYSLVPILILRILLGVRLRGLGE